MPSILGNKINEQIQFQTELYLVIWRAKVNVRIESNRIMLCRFLIFVFAPIPYPFFFLFSRLYNWKQLKCAEFYCLRDYVSHLFNEVDSYRRPNACDRQKKRWYKRFSFAFYFYLWFYFCLHCVFWYHFISSMLSDSLKK